MADGYLNFDTKINEKPVENIICSITAGVVSKEYELEGENDNGNS